MRAAADAVGVDGARSVMEKEEGISSSASIATGQGNVLGATARGSNRSDSARALEARHDERVTLNGRNSCAPLSQRKVPVFQN